MSNPIITINNELLEKPSSIEKGGTGSSNSAEACNNLNALYLGVPANTITSDSDLNDYTEAKVYSVDGEVSSTLINCPTLFGFKLIVEYLNSSTYIIQTIIDTDGKSYIRYCISNIWTPWNLTIMTIDDIINHAITADRLSNERNISLTGGATGNVDFDGSKNVVIDVTELDVTYVKKGILPVEFGGTGTSNGSDIVANAADHLSSNKKIGLTGGVTGTPTVFNSTVDINIPITTIDPDYMQKAVPVNKGGTGALTAGGALTNLGAAPKESPEFTGTPLAPYNTDYTTYRMRNGAIGTSSPSGILNGAIYYQYD